MMTLRQMAGRLLGLFHPAESASQAVETVDRDEVIRVIDRLARQRRGMSAAELLSSYRSGRLEMSGDITDLLVYSDLLRPDDPIFFDKSSTAPEFKARLALR